MLNFIFTLTIFTTKLANLDPEIGEQMIKMNITRRYCIHFDTLVSSQRI